MAIEKCFQEGPVLVLEINFKGCNLAHILAKTLGDEVSQCYTRALEGLEWLAMVQSKQTLECETLPKMREHVSRKALESKQ